MKFRDNLPYRVEVWAADRMAIEETLAACSGFDLAKLCYSAALLRYPKARIALRHLSRVIDERIPGLPPAN